MSKTNTITLRIPEELKRRIEKIAKKQGVSMNQFAMYAWPRKLGRGKQTNGSKATLRVKEKKRSMLTLTKP